MRRVETEVSAVAREVDMKSGMAATTARWLASDCFWSVSSTAITPIPISTPSG